MAMYEVLKELTLVVDNEKVRNEQQFGVGYNSTHEFYGVLLEEIEEFKESFNFFEKEIASLWTSIKENSEAVPTNTIKTLTDQSLKTSMYALAELTQVSAVLRRYLEQIAENRLPMVDLMEIRSLGLNVPQEQDTFGVTREEFDAFKKIYESTAYTEEHSANLAGITVTKWRLIKENFMVLSNIFGESVYTE